MFFMLSDVLHGNLCLGSGLMALPGLFLGNGGLILVEALGGGGLGLDSLSVCLICLFVGS